MSIETQKFADLMVLGMTDEDVLKSIKYHLEQSEKGLAEHITVASHLITALNNAYGNGSYVVYQTLGILPSQQ